jgi:tRNA dimethylallyltransferase
MAAKVISVVGPTATGKTKLGVLLAQRYDGEVVSVDSMQLYRGMTIGTAAPTEEEQEGIPHHMIAVADPRENYSVARYVQEADACVQDILHRGKRPILVGGTGLYFDSLLRGIDFAAGTKDGACRRELQTRLEKEGIEPLLAELQAADPAAAERLSPNDTKRILRALEVWYETGETITAHDARTRALPPRYESVTFALTYAQREELRRCIDLRVDKMVEAGLLGEVETLLKGGVPPTATALQAIGYKQFLAVERGEITVEEAVEEVKLRSRQYAKRQLTWLRHKEGIHWITWEKTRDFRYALQIATEICTAEGLG